MENSVNEKKAKSSKPNGYASLRIKKEIKKRIMSDLARINKKDYGRKVDLSEYLDLLMGLFTLEHICQLQEGSLSNADRFEREYREYIANNGPMPKDEYLGKRLSGEIALSECPNVNNANKGNDVSN